MLSSPSLPSAVRAQYRGLSPRRKALWILALLSAVACVVGLLGWVLFAPDFNRKDVSSWFDLAAYLDSADALRARATLYTLTPWPPDNLQVNQYHPLFALTFSIFADLPFRVLAAAGILVQAASYLLAWSVWYRLLGTLGLRKAAESVVTWLPLALFYVNWYTNMAYWNITSTLILLATLLIWALARERTALAVLIALPMAFTKPFWLFPLLLPLVLRRWKFFVQVLGGLVAGYLVLNAAYILAVGPPYGWQSLRDYAQFLVSIPQLYPWEGAGPTFMHLNHSWMQILYHYAGFQDWVPAAVLAIKALMAGSVLWAVVAAWRRRITLDREPELALLCVWLGYLVAMAMLDQLWELGAGIVVFTLLQSAASPAVRRFSLLFLLYALSVITILLGYAAGLDVIIPHEVLPATMIALLVLYVPALAWLWSALAARQPVRTLPA